MANATLIYYWKFFFLYWIYFASLHPWRQFSSWLSLVVSHLSCYGYFDLGLRHEDFFWISICLKDFFLLIIRMPNQRNRTNTQTSGKIFLILNLRTLAFYLTNCLVHNFLNLLSALLICYDFAFLDWYLTFYIDSNLQIKMFSFLFSPAFDVLWLDCAKSFFVNLIRSSFDI